jgi:hypothetical protein
LGWGNHLIRVAWRNPLRRHEDHAGSFLFAISLALDKVRVGSVDDESLALAANDIVRAYLDREAITYDDYKLWRKLNPLIFTSIVDENNELIGFFDIFPLKSGAGEDIIAGRLTERSLTADHIVPLAENRTASHLHIATIIVNPRQKTFMQMIANELLLLKMREFIQGHYAPIEMRTYTAFGQSLAGEALLKRCGFSVAVLSKDNEQRLPLYVLRASNSSRAIFRFDRIDDSLSRNSKLKELDSRIEGIELQLRAIIADVTNGDLNQLPPHVRQKVDERLHTESNKNAAFDIVRYKQLSATLEFCGLRELQDTILSRSLWPKLQPRFANRETFSAKFGQISVLRNAIRHSRSVDEIVRMEGEAGVLWFERVLHKTLNSES